jgi:hypothetical protein
MIPCRKPIIIKTENMNCTSYIDNVVTRAGGHHHNHHGDHHHQTLMGQLNDELTHDLQDMEATLSTLQDDFSGLVATAVTVDQTYHHVARASDEVAAVTALKNQANDAILSAATRFADLE